MGCARWAVAEPIGMLKPSIRSSACQYQIAGAPLRGILTALASCAWTAQNSWLVLAGADNSRLTDPPDACCSPCHARCC